MRDDEDGVTMRTVRVPEQLRAAGCRAWAVVEPDGHVAYCLDETLTPAEADAAATRLRERATTG